MADIKEMIRELAVAISKALEKSEAEGGTIDTAIRKIRAEGYEVRVVLDACVGYSEKDPESQPDTLGNIQIHPEITSNDRREMRKLGFDPALRPPKKEDLI